MIRLVHQGDAGRHSGHGGRGGGLAGKEIGATGCREVKFVRLLNGKDCSAGQLAKLNTFVFII